MNAKNHTSDYLDFDRTLNRALKILKSEKQYKIGFLIIVGINSGLRISDLLSLKYTDFNVDSIELKEKKTKKYRKITLNDNIKSAYKILLHRQKDKVINDEDFVFTSNKDTVFATRSVNRLLQQLLSEGKNKLLKISSHSLRKSFGRRCFYNNGENERSLVFLSHIFGHSSISLTRIYLGLRESEIESVYLNL